MDQPYDYENEPELNAIAARLVRERAIPAAAFRGDLRRRLARGGRGVAARPRLWVAGYLGSGAALLAVAAVGLTGLGPFAA